MRPNMNPKEELNTIITGEAIEDMMLSIILCDCSDDEEKLRCIKKYRNAINHIKKPTQEMIDLHDFLWEL